MADTIHGTYTPDPMHVILGFRVEISGAGGGSDADSAWETCSGGSLNIEIADASTGTTTPGHKYIEEVTLRGPLTSGRKAMVDWINATVRGEPALRDVRITELRKKGPDRSYTYHDCFPVSYRPPRVDAGDDGLLEERFTFKPNRITDRVL